jgi:lipid-A-disaccharide synthase
LVNLVLGKDAVPELIQGRATPENMAAALARYLTDDGYRDQVKSELGRVPSLLGGTGASERAARAIGAYL